MLQMSETTGERDREREKEKEKEDMKERYLQASMTQLKQTSSLMLDAPREISKKSYSLAPDMLNGWKPRRQQRVNFQNVFPINFSSLIIDEVVKQIVKRSSKYELAYLGPRKQNSYKLHENRAYENPYPIDKKMQPYLPERVGVSKMAKITQTNLTFNSDFESGNLDCAIRISDSQYDLFMRVDSNTKGHTNWYYFQIENKSWIGSVQFNLLNFRREKSLYQRGMKPYVKSERSGQEWVQAGKKVTYEKKSLRYKFLYDEDQDYADSLYTYFTMSFTYDFDIADDKVCFAYCVPYTYSDVLKLVREISILPHVTFETGWRTLSGLPVPLIQITDFQQPTYNKKVVLITARIHPGESNSSHVCEGFIKAVISQEPRYIQLRKRYHFYIIPMLNPDGVVAGNYRTSLFGKDLNRTFNQSRKYAFPQIFHLFEFTQKLKKQHKQRLTIYLDLHGHSVKKNVFFYGPDYNIAHNYYNQSRDYAKILGNLTPMFRYYSCIFRISSEKATTARATFNRVINIPFTYTLESSNGGYYDSTDHQEKTFTAIRWSEMGATLAKGLGIWIETKKKNPSPSRLRNKKFMIDSDEEEDQNEEKTEKQKLLEQEPPGKEKNSDDEISEGKSDSQPEDEDLKEEELNLIEKEIEGKKDVDSPGKKKEEKSDYVSRLHPISPDKSERGANRRNNELDWSQNLRNSRNYSIRKSSPIAKRQRLPPINLQTNPNQFMSKNLSKKKRISISQALNNLTHIEVRPPVIEPDKRMQRISISQMMIEVKEGIKEGMKEDIKEGMKQEKAIMTRKTSKQQMMNKIIK